MSTLEGVVAELSNDNLESHREVESLRERLQLLEKVFMFVDFEELQKVVDKLSKQPAEPQNGISPPVVSQSCNAGGRQIVPASLVEHFPTKSGSLGSLISGTSEEEQDRAGGAVAKAKLRNKGIAKGSPVTSGTEDGVEAELSKEAEIRSPPSPSKDNEGVSNLSIPRSKAQALRGAMAAKTPPHQASRKACTDPATNVRTRHSENTSTTGAELASAIRYPPRSKCVEFAEKHRQRYGPTSTLPTFIYERLGQEGMTDEDIDKIGRGSCQVRPSDDRAVD